MVKVFTGAFKKKNDEIRTMVFVRLEDIPKSFLSSKIGPAAKPKLLPDGIELVWDLSESNFRTFNWNTAVGDVATKLLEGKEKDNFVKKHLT